MLACETLASPRARAVRERTCRPADAPTRTGAAARGQWCRLRSRTPAHDAPGPGSVPPRARASASRPTSPPVVRDLGAAVDVHTALELVRVEPVVTRQERRQLPPRTHHAVHLDPVTRRQNRRLIEQRTVPIGEARERRRNLGVSERYALAQIDRRGRVINPDHHQLGTGQQRLGHRHIDACIRTHARASRAQPRLCCQRGQLLISVSGEGVSVHRAPAAVALMTRARSASVGLHCLRMLFGSRSRAR